MSPTHHPHPPPLPRRIIGETGRLLPAFLLGALTTVIGSAAAYMMMPLGRFIGEDGWKIASALTVCGEEGDCVCGGPGRGERGKVLQGAGQGCGFCWSACDLYCTVLLVSCTALCCLPLSCTAHSAQGPTQAVYSSPAWTPPHADPPMLIEVLPLIPYHPSMQARHIGGAVNYMAVTDALAVSPSVFGAGLAADDLILTLYFTTIYTLAKSIPPDPPSAAMTARAETGGSETDAAAAEASSSSGTSNGGAAPSDQAGRSGSTGGHGGGIETKPIHVSGLRGQVAALGPDALVSLEWFGVLLSSVELRGAALCIPIIWLLLLLLRALGLTSHSLPPILNPILHQVPPGLTSLAVSVLICHTAFTLSRALGLPGQFLTILTALSVAAATIAPHLLGPLASSAQGLAQILMQVRIGWCPRFPLMWIYISDKVMQVWIKMSLIASGMGPQIRCQVRIRRLLWCGSIDPIW